MDVRFRGEPLGALLGGLLVVLPLQALAWQPELEPPAAGYHAPQTAFRIRLPADLTPEQLQSLSLELDGIDVTAMVGLEDEFAVFAPPNALVPGEHELRLVEYADSGDIRELATWTFQVRESTTFQAASWEGRGSLGVSERIADQNLTTSPETTQVQGALGVAGQVGDRRWQVNGQADVLYNRQPELMPTGETFDLNSYQISGRYDAARMTLGHQTLGPDSLVVGGFHRRGVSASASTWNDRLAVQGFSLRTEPVVGFRHSLGFDDPDHRTSGVVLAAQPLPDSPEALSLGVSYAQGAGDDTGLGVAGDRASPSGDAVGASADSLLWDRRLRLRGEVAESRFDLDGEGGLDSESDRAYSVLALYTPTGPADFAGQPLSWNVGIEHVEIGSYYRSLANPGLPNDRRALRLFSEASWNGLSTGLTLGHETDNVAGVAGVPITATEQLRLHLGYSPAVTDEAPGWSLFAQPAYSASLSLSRQAYDDAPADTGLELDRATEDLQLSAYFFPGPWSWGLGYGLSRFDDKTDVSPDSVNHLAYFSASVPLFSERLQLSPELQWNSLRYPDLDYDVRTVLARLALAAALVPDRVSLVLDFTLNREADSDDTLESETRYVQANLSWSLWQPNGYRPGTAVYLSGGYQDTRDHVNRTDEDLYQVFAGVNIGWSAAGR